MCPIYGASVDTGQNKGDRLGGEVAVVNTRIAAGCRPLDLGTAQRPGFFQQTVLHELLHTEGVVPPGAPHTCKESPAGLLAPHIRTFGPAAVIDPALSKLDPEARDVMFPGIIYPLAEATLDAGNDDYLRAPLATLRLEDSVFLTGGTPGPAGPQVPPERLTTHGDTSRVVPGPVATAP